MEIVAPNPDRDRFIDLVRVTSMVTVVVLHWLSVMPALTAGRVVDQNVVAVVPGLWPLTWTWRCHGAVLLRGRLRELGLLD